MKEAATLIILFLITNQLFSLGGDLYNHGGALGMVLGGMCILLGALFGAVFIGIVINIIDRK